MPDSKNVLLAADQDARTQSAQEPANSSTFPCPLKQASAIEVIVIGEDDKGIPNLKVALRNSKSKELIGVTDGKGKHRFVGLEEGKYKITLCNMDEGAWELINTRALAGDAAKSKGTTTWVSAPKTETEPVTHNVAQGDCVASIADTYGFFPGTIQDFEKNAQLRIKRGDLYILAPGDVVAIPEKCLKEVAVSSANLYTLRRKGVPELFTIRFLDHLEKPRAGAEYLICIEDPDGNQLAQRKGKLAPDGFLRELIPPFADYAEITLGKGKDQQVYDFELGHIDPLDSIAGLQARLNNLNFDCGEVDGAFGDKTRAAVQQIQKQKGLNITNDISDELTSFLKKMYLS
jgi:hypothetical protein